MGKRDPSSMVRAIQELSWSERRVVLERPRASQAAEAVWTVVEDRLQCLRSCPHGKSPHVVSTAAPAAFNATGAGTAVVRSTH